MDFESYFKKKQKEEMEGGTYFKLFWKLEKIRK